MSDKTAGTLFTPDDERTVRFLKEALEDPEGEAIVLSFRFREDGSRDTNLKYKGSKNRGAGLVQTCIDLSIGMGQHEVVIDFIRKSRFVLDQAEQYIAAELAKRNANN